MILAQKITDQRKKNGWSQEELAEKLNVSRQSVSKWESEQSVPDLQKIIQLAELFGVSTDFLLKDNVETSSIKNESFQNTESEPAEPEKQNSIEKPKAKNKKLEIFSAIYWCAIVGGYMVTNIFTHAWKTTWVIYPVAGIIWGAINMALDENKRSNK